MTTAASLGLLKGFKGANASLEKELEKAPEAETQDDTETVNVDLNAMDAQELTDLVVGMGGELPEAWTSLSLKDKRAWIEKEFGDEQPSTVEPTSPLELKEQDGEVVKLPSKVDPDPTPSVAEAAPKKEKKAKKPKNEVAVAAKALDGVVQVVGEDVISDIVHSVENLTQDQAMSLVHQLSEETEVTYFKLGGVLSVIAANKWIGQYGTFKEYVDKEHGINYRRAMYWISIYNSLVESKVPWEKVKELGWTKLTLLAPVLTLDNVDDWVSIGKGQTVLQLAETIKASQNSDKALTDETSSAPTTTTKTFKVHSGQKETIEAAIVKAKEQAQTTVDTVALENICLDYLSSPTLKQKLKDLGIEAAITLLTEVFPEADITVAT